MTFLRCQQQLRNWKLLYISQANAIYFLSRNILEEYDHQKQQIEGLEAKLKVGAGG